MLARHPLPLIDPELIDPGTMAGEELTNRARRVLDRFNIALVNRDAEALRGLFVNNAYWRDELAFTYHLRTFFAAEVIAEALLETGALRGVEGVAVDGEAQFIAAAETLVSLIHIKKMELTPLAIH